ncbi:uncharacterized protein LOC144653841 [Oculina patagonica]
MSSKDAKGSSDSLQTKTKKKEKTKKESKKEKKEKKEKSKKRDSKDLDNDSVNDNSVEIEEGDKEDSSPKSKKFGIFRLSGRKSKSDKRNSKHGSSDSLKRQSGDSADFESRGSEFSLEGSTASGEVSTTITEMSTTSAEVSTTITEVPTTSAEVSTTKVEMSTTRAEVSTVSEVPTSSAEVDESSEIEMPREEEALVIETSSEVKIVSAAHSDLTEDKDTKKAGTEQTQKEDSSTKQDEINEKLAKDTLKVESVSVQEQTPVASEVQTFEFKLQSSVTSNEVTKNAEVNEEQHNKAEENKEESARLAIEENVSTHEKDHVIEPEPEHKYEVSLEDVKIEQDREITSSEDDSVDTVISTEALNNKGLSEVNEETEYGTQRNMDVEEPIISTYRERKGAVQSTSQELPPIDEEAIVLSYENKTQQEIREEQQVQEEPITLASKERREDVLMSEITFNEEPVTESEPALLIKSETLKKEEKIHGEGQAEDPSKEELLIPTFVQRKANNTEEEQEKQEAPVNEEAMALSYPDKEEDQIHNESHNGPIADEEEPVVLTTDKKDGNQIEEQIKEFLKLESKIEERPTQESETVKKNKEAEKITARDTPKENESQNDRRESAPFDETGTFITSTPKRAWINTVQDTRADAGNEEHRASSAVSYNITRFKGGSVVKFHYKVEIVNNIRDAKMSTKLLLARLAEINKKLRMLQKELLEVQKSDDNNNQANVTEVSAET